MSRSLISSVEPLESRIAPAALAVLNPLVALAAGMSETGTPTVIGMPEQSAAHARALFFRNFGGSHVLVTSSESTESAA